MFSRTFRQFKKPTRSSGLHFFSQPNYQGNANAWPCEVVKITFQPVKDMLDMVPIKTNTGIIRTPKGLDFVNKLHKVVDSIKVSEANLESFDKAINPTNESRAISEKELDLIESISDFYLPVHYFTKKETQEFMEGMKRLLTWADNERNSPGSTMGPY